MKKKIIAMFLAMLMIISVVKPVASAESLTINKASATLVSGETLQLSVSVNGLQKSAAWGSSNTNVATVSDSGLVTAKAAGSSVITAMCSGATIECLISVVKKTESSTYRYNVLILDTSGSMAGTPDSYQKTAAKRFCSKILKTSGKNYVAIVSLNSSSNVVCGFSNDYATLAGKINQMSARGNTNLNQALAKAGELLSSVNKTGNVLKNIILCSDGLPTVGTSTKSGRYQYSDHSSYHYSNAAYNTATTLKNKKYFIYALGFFHSSTGNNLVFGKRLMKDLASQDKYYIIKNPEDLDKVFTEIKEEITKVTLNKSTLTLYVGDTTTLYAKENGATKKASWSSSSSKIASVDSNGKIRAKSAGTTTITATINGKSATCKVTVKTKVTLKLNKTSMTLYEKEKGQLTATITGTSQKATYTSANTSIATVNANGVVTAKKAGKTTITATVGGKKATCTVTVKKATHPLYSMYFKSKPVYWKDIRSGKKYKVDEVGLRLVLNDSAVITKCGAYAVKSGSYWRVAMGFKGNHVTSAYVSAYVAYQGKIVVDAYKNSGSTSLNKFVMTKDSDNIWRWNSFNTVYFNLFDINGKNIANNNVGKQSENTTIYSDLTRMKNWLKK